MEILQAVFVLWYHLLGDKINKNNHIGLQLNISHYTNNVAYCQDNH